MSMSSKRAQSSVNLPPSKKAKLGTEETYSIEYQRVAWETLRKNLSDVLNKSTAYNIKHIIAELFSQNLVKGMGLFCRACIKSQIESPRYTDTYASIVSLVNSKFPEIGHLLLRRVLLQLKTAVKRNDNPQLVAAVKFLAHLVNQQVAHEVVALEVLTALLKKPTDESVEVAVEFVKVCGSILQDLCPKGLHDIFKRFRRIVHEGEIDRRVQFRIEELIFIRKAKFEGHPAIRPELDLVKSEDQITHKVSLDDEIDPEISQDVFKPDPKFLENEVLYEKLKKSVLGEESEDDSESDDDDEEDFAEEDPTENNLTNLCRRIDLTIMSHIDSKDLGQELLKLELEPGQEMEICTKLFEYCMQERKYCKYYGFFGQQLCFLDRPYQENFEKCLREQLSMIHSLETNKLSNLAKFVEDLSGTDALPWHVLAYICLSEEDTTSSARIFVKSLLQQLSENIGKGVLSILEGLDEISK